MFFFLKQCKAEVFVHPLGYKASQFICCLSAPIVRTWTPSPVLPLPSCSRGIDPNQSLAFIFYLCKYATIISVLPGAWSSSSSYSSSRYWHIVVRRHNCCCGCYWAANRFPQETLPCLLRKAGFVLFVFLNEPSCEHLPRSHLSSMSNFCLVSLLLFFLAKAATPRLSMLWSWHTCPGRRLK